MAALYDESATYSFDSGKYMATREAIEGGLKDYFTKHPGARLAVQQTKVDWTKGQRFCRRSITVSCGEEAFMHATEIIGWDPANSTLRSWVFDSEGGFSEGTWTQEENRWIRAYGLHAV